MIYLTQFPNKAIDVFKYQSLIHDASQRYKWKAVLAYDFYFHHSVAEDPSVFWAVTDTAVHRLLHGQGIGENLGEDGPGGIPFFTKKIPTGMLPVQQGPV